MSRTVLIAVLSIAGASLVVTGLGLGSWWAIAGGTVTLAGAAWVITEVR